MASLSLIQKITRLAVNNFKRDSCKSTGLLSSDYEQLKKLVSNITVSDINIDPALLEDRGIYKYSPTRGPAPVTYMKIYEDSDVTICVFILKRGVKLPLHDHPNMNGILKVIHGTVSIQSYTMDQPVQSNSRGKVLGSTFPGIYPAVKHPCIKVATSDPVCELNPDRHNLHEISTVDGLSAFLDILSPPYGVDERSGEERDCHYFQEIDVNLSENLQPGCVYLVNITNPPEFWCDEVKYNGPPVADLESVTNGQNES